MSEKVSRTTEDGPGAQIGEVKPGVGAKLDAAAEMTFPGSDPVSITTEAGLRMDTGALREPITSSMAVRRMVAAGLQAAHASESAMLTRLNEAKPVSAALGAAVERLRSEGEEQLIRVTRALAVFGQSADRSLEGTAPPALESGPLGDLALTFALRVEGQRALGTYEVLEQVASRTDLTDVAQYTQESMAIKRRMLDELARLCDAGLIEDAIRAGGDALPAPVLHQVFGA